MTRFARAKGSKASNKRVPEDASSWHEMKQQYLTEQAAEKTTASNVATSTSSITVRNKVQNDQVESKWATMGELNSDSLNLKKGCVKRKNKSRTSQDDDTKNYLNANKTVDVNTTKKTKKKRNIVNKMLEGEKISVEVDSYPKKSKKRKVEDIVISNKGCTQLKDGKNIFKKKKKEFSPEYTIKSQNKGNVFEDGKSPKLVMEDFPQKKMKKDKERHTGSVDKYLHERNWQSNYNHEQKKSKSASNNFSEERKKFRRKEKNMPMTININGQELTIVPFDGFYIKQEDALRLKDLRKQLIKEGIPKIEVQKILKLERRKAEKSLARAKKKVCFHCRKFGHNLSACPEIEDKKDTAVGICYKCGSTEHAYFDCKVTHNDNFKFAECFICKEQGHIARQCPDNPRGLYPKGGACKLCGDVTHLKKDCPKLVSEKEEQTLTLSLRKGSKVESLDEDVKLNSNKLKLKKSKKMVKF